jgi:hypothetical protein
MKRTILFLALSCSLHAEDDTATWNTLARSLEQRAFASRYPWHRNIGTTVFWVGELPRPGDPGNLRSAWDPNWLANAAHENPFYVALPYNDIIGAQRTKPKAAAAVPWFKRTFVRQGQSVLRGRWVAIRYGNKVCYAQWADAGPYHTDDVAYVFGSARPLPHPNNDAGLDVSPAVRDYLALHGLDSCDWRFVDANAVPPGPWKPPVARPGLFHDPGEPQLTKAPNE